MKHNPKKGKARNHAAKRHDDHDTLFRGAFSMPGIARAHLLHVLDETELAHLQLDTLTLVSGSFVDEQLSKSITDVCWRCKVNNQEKELMVSFLFEHKSKAPREPIQLQLLRYILGIWRQDLAERRQLSFVIPLVVYHGKKAWPKKRLADSFKMLPAPLLKYLPEFDFVLTDITRMPDEVIRVKEQLGALRSVYSAFKYAFEEHLLLEHFNNILIFVEGLGNPAMDDLLFKMIFTYIQRRTNLNLNQLQVIMESATGKTKEKVLSTYDRIIAAGREEGLQKGIEIGMENKTYEVIHSLILSTDWNDEKIAMVVGVLPNRVAEIRAKRSA